MEDMRRLHSMGMIGDTEMATIEAEFKNGDLGKRIEDLQAERKVTNAKDIHRRLSKGEKKRIKKARQELMRQITLTT